MEDTGTSIFIAFCITMTLAASLMMCVCCRRNKNNGGSAPCEEHPSDDSRNNNGQPKKVVNDNGSMDVALPLEVDNVEAAKREPQAAQRELPEIPPNPRDDSLRPIGEPVYNTVDETSPAFATTSGTSRSSGELAARPISDCVSNGPVLNQTCRETSSDTDTYDDPGQLYTRANKIVVRCDATGTEHPPPVPEKRFNSAESSPSIYSTGRPVSAANAVAGRSSASEIPFISSPADSTQDLGNVENQVSEADRRYHSNLQYTVISVRESLAYLKENMSRPSQAPTESIYSVVPEDGDGMYDEIRSGQNSAASSMTYSKIESTDNSATINSRPDPPTVESLRNVAQAAHSRNASYSSGIGETIDVHIRTPDGSNFNRGSMLGPDPNGGSIPLYATVNKANKSRQSAQLFEDCQSANDSVEELYSKVQKDNSHGARPKQFNKEHEKPCAVQPSLNSAYSEPVTENGHLMPSDRGSGVVRNSSLCGEDPGYERIHDSPKYWSEKFEKPFQARSNGASDRTSQQSQQLLQPALRPEEVHSDLDFGYETVPGNPGFGNYESIQDGPTYIYRDEENEPGYEAVANQSEYSGYEQVSDPAFQRSDPNYESVRYSTRTDISPRLEAGQSEPNYWDIQSREEMSYPLYERIRNQEDDQIDPNYEKVKTASELSYESSEPGYARIPPSEYGYENVRDRDELNEEQTDPGYEKIFENKLELHVEWNRSSPVQSGSDYSNPRLNPLPSVRGDPWSEESSVSNGLEGIETRLTSDEIFQNPTEQITLPSTTLFVTEHGESNQQTKDETIYIPLEDEQPPSLL